MHKQFYQQRELDSSGTIALLAKSRAHALLGDNR
jgi:hypothetical protein